MASSDDDLVAQFSAVTGANPSMAEKALAQTNYNLEEAVSLYFAQRDEGEQEAFDDDEPQDPIAPAPDSAQGASYPPQGASYPPLPTGAPTGRNTTAGSSRGGAQARGPVTLRDLQRGADDEDEETERNQDLFAGGEKSGLAVQNPDEGGGPQDYFRNIMNQARQNRERPPGTDEPEESTAAPPRSNFFTGRAQTLGGDDAPSRVVEGSVPGGPQSRQRLPRVTRTLHLWADGVSIDDGPLLRFDDPANAHIMQEINQGRAPKALLDVQPDQEVDLNLEPHKGENYITPKRKYVPFSGQGQRLGSPTATIASSSAAPSAPTPSASTPSAGATPAQDVSIDESQPTVTLQIRLGDGTRLTSRFNTSHTIGHVYEFVNRASPTSQRRAYALMTTFPSKELEDHSAVLGDMSDFKRGGVVVQKWK